MQARKKRVWITTTAMLAVAASILVTSGAAEAATLNLGPSDVYLSKTYYATPHYKAATGGASISNVGVNETCGGGGRVNVGFRTNPGYSGELTQFPSVGYGIPSATFRNVGAPPGYYYIFSAGTYYFNAELGCSAGTWTGTVTW